MRYVITGGGGFIGSNIAEALVRRGDAVGIIDNFSSGSRKNLPFSPKSGVEIIEGDVRDISVCRQAVRGADCVLHHAALVSVHLSVKEPLLTNEINATGTLNMLVAARDAGVQKFVFAGSSAVYGRCEAGEYGATSFSHGQDNGIREDTKPHPLSPYAVSKLVGEEYCRIFSTIYDVNTVVLRYFNVYGKRQSFLSDYAGVIPRFIVALLSGAEPVIYGDGFQTRDFIHVEDVVAANLAACALHEKRPEAVFNIAGGHSISIMELLLIIQDITGIKTPIRFEKARPGDIKYSRADISCAEKQLGFRPRVSIRDGLAKTVAWFRENLHNAVR